MMGPRYYLFIIICGILIQTSISAPVMKIRNFNLLQQDLTVKPNSRILVPCKFLPVLPIDATKMILEWGKISEVDGTYTPLIQLNGDGVKTFQETSKKYDLFVPLVRKGNCTLIIRHTDATDSGLYEVWLALDGELHETGHKTRITVSVEKQTSGGTRGSKSRANIIPTEMTTVADIKDINATPTPVTNSSDFFTWLLDNHGRQTIIGVMVVMSFLTFTSMLSLIVCCLDCTSEDEDDEDEESPKEINQTAAQGEASVHVENETPTPVNATSGYMKEGKDLSSDDSSSSGEETEESDCKCSMCAEKTP